MEVRPDMLNGVAAGPHPTQWDFQGVRHLGIEEIRQIVGLCAKHFFAPDRELPHLHDKFVFDGHFGLGRFPAAIGKHAVKHQADLIVVVKSGRRDENALNRHFGLGEVISVRPNSRGTDEQFRSYEGEGCGHPIKAFHILISLIGSELLLVQRWWLSTSRAEHSRKSRSKTALSSMT